MTKWVVLGVLVVTAGIAAATCDFPYYPEYADFFCRYDEVTPLMAKKIPSYDAPPTLTDNAVMCEPLLLKDSKGMPYFYSIDIYDGDDADIPRDWNKVVKVLNKGDLMPAEELRDIVLGIREHHGKDFYSMGVAAYTYAGPVVAGTSRSFCRPLGYYDKALTVARKEYPMGDLYLKRIIGRCPGAYQVYEFVTGESRSIIIKTEPMRPDLGYAVIADLDDIARERAERLKILADPSTNDWNMCDDNAKLWKMIDAEVPDAQVEGELPRLLLNDNMDTDYEVIECVPDPDVSLGSPSATCWSWASPARRWAR